MQTPYESAKAQADTLDGNVRRASEALRAIPGIGSGVMGLTPDSVKATPAYRTARATYDNAFKMLRTFNAFYVRTYKREIAADRKARGR